LVPSATARGAIVNDPFAASHRIGEWGPLAPERFQATRCFFCTFFPSPALARGV